MGGASDVESQRRAGPMLLGEGMALGLLITTALHVIVLFGASGSF